MKNNHKTLFFLLGLCCFAVIFIPIAAAGTLIITNLRCEYLENPLGIDVSNPRLSWILESAKRGQMQKAYQVLVASTQENLTNNIGDLWDSGKIDSDQSVHVVYKGNNLLRRCTVSGKCVSGTKIAKLHCGVIRRFGAWAC